MQTYDITNPRTLETTQVQADDWQTACRESGVPDGCVLYPEPDDKVTAFFHNASGTPFGITAKDAESALAWAVQHLDTTRAADKRNTLDLVREYFNCREADIDAEGDIWIADPQAGHWLDDADKAAFDAWRAS